MRGYLADLRAPSDARWVRFGHLVQRSKDADRRELEPLSVFLDGGVVPRADRAGDNHNRLGADMDKYLHVRPGDLVFNKLRTWQGGFGASQFEGVVSPAYFVCRPTPALNSRYADYLLHSQPYLRELTRVSKWMPPSQFDISWEELKTLPILVPPVRTQERVASFLDAETQRIDQVIAIKRRMVHVLEERQQAVIDRAFGCTSVRRRWDGVPVSPGEGPATARLGALASINGGVTVDSSRVAEDAVELSYLRVANVQDGGLDLSDVKAIVLERRAVDRFLLRSGDVLMTEGGDPDKLGRGAVWRGQIDPCVTQNHVFFVRPDHRVLSSDYLSLLTQTSYARAYFETTASKTTGIASTSSSKIAAFKVPVLPLPSQEQVVDAVRCILATTDQAASTIGVQIDLLRERRRSLITAAVTGEIEVP